MAKKRLGIGRRVGTRGSRKKCAGIEGCGELFAALTAFVATRSNALAKTQNLEKQTIKDEEK